MIQVWREGKIEGRNRAVNGGRGMIGKDLGRNWEKMVAVEGSGIRGREVGRCGVATRVEEGGRLGRKAVKGPVVTASRIRHAHQGGICQLADPKRRESAKRREDACRNCCACARSQQLHWHGGS